jgi:hypothetical protein
VDKSGFTRRWEHYRATKTAVFWLCASCVAATIITGFSWGGWVTGCTAAHGDAGG